MPSGYTKTKDKEIKGIIAYYQSGHTMDECAEKFGRSKSTVKKYVDEAKSGKYGDFTHKVEQIKKRNSEDILKTLYDDKTNEIIEKYRNIILNEDNIEAQITGQAKLQFFTNTIGMIYDKILRMQQLDNHASRVEVDLTVDNGFKRAIKSIASNINPDELEGD